MCGQAETMQCARCNALAKMQQIAIAKAIFLKMQYPKDSAGLRCYHDHTVMFLLLATNLVFWCYTEKKGVLL